MGCCCKCCCCVILVITLLIATSAGLFAGLFPYPAHASCTVEWQVGKSCSNIEFDITQQIKQWEDTVCTENQRCGYKFLKSSENTIWGTRTTPVTAYVDSFNFKFAETSDGCEIVGSSRSDTWYAVLDFGYNYCNLKNLILGIGLNKASGYTENSSNSVCTLYTDNYCKNYTD